MTRQEFENSNGGIALETHCAPPERSSPEALRHEARQVLDSPLFRAVQEAFDGYMMILNRHRQVLATNSRLLLDLGCETQEPLLGKRPGEVLACIHADEMLAGCGTSRACKLCGALAAILESRENLKPSAGECLASVKRDDHIESAEFRVRATPVKFGDEFYTVVVFNDISGDKRRETLERVFFHDVFNTLSGLIGWSTLLDQRFDSIDPRDAARKIVVLTNRLIREIKDQQTLLRAEAGDLEVSRDLFPVNEIFNMLEVVFSAHEAAEDKTFVVERADSDAAVYTDVSLLIRVLVNMIKNALEASRDDEAVRAWFERRDGQPVFLVHNPAVLPTEVALRIFKRSFSTKARSGRGIGTYSMKLFGERYLGGEVSFASEPETGTVFRIALPEGPLGDSE